VTSGNQPDRCRDQEQFEQYRKRRRAASAKQRRGDDQNRRRQVQGDHHRERADAQRRDVQRQIRGLQQTQLDVQPRVGGERRPARADV